MNYSEHDNNVPTLCPIKRFMRLIEKVTDVVLISCSLPSAYLKHRKAAMLLTAGPGNDP